MKIADKSAKRPAIYFNSKLFKIGPHTILRLPKSASAKLPSRGMTKIKGTINDFSFQTVLEPDGTGSHWFRVDETMLRDAQVKEGDTVSLEIKPSKEWPEPKVPVDLRDALAAAPQAHTLWLAITPMARWDWIRWIRATKQSETRKKRIEVACSKLKAGTRRPCCFNRNICTEPDVSHRGVLLEPTQNAAA